MMIANGGGLVQLIKRWYLVHDLLMLLLKEARIYTLLKQEQRGLCRVSLMVKQIPVIIMTIGIIQKQK
nr:MAG TPA: hypothetical protein [Caudoviricetes sp.]